MAPSKAAAAPASSASVLESIKSKVRNVHARLAALGSQPGRVVKTNSSAHDTTIKTEHLPTTTTEQPPANPPTDPTPPLALPIALKPSDFELGARLGRGKFGRVYLARHTATHYICALKVLSKESCTASHSEPLVRRELEVHQNLAHPHILRLLAWFHDARAVYLVLEYAPGGSLFALQQQQPQSRFSERDAAGYVAQMASALGYLRAKKVLHRDVKPENILLGIHGEVKLADFGYSVHSQSGARTTLCGTLDYVSPEVARILLGVDVEEERYTHAVDQWSLGILAYELLVGKPPFERESAEETRACIAAFDGEVEFPEYVSAGARDLVVKLLHVMAEQRLGFDEVMAHPWIVGHVSGAILD